MGSCELVNLITGLACTIAKGKTQQEIAILSTFFVQLGDSLATILTINFE